MLSNLIDNSFGHVTIAWVKFSCRGLTAIYNSHFGQGGESYSMDFSAVLDFSKPLDVTVFDQLVSTFYNSSGPKVSLRHYLKQAEAGDVLKQYQQHQKAWETVDKIIEQSKNINSKVNPLLLFLVHCITSS